MALITLLDIAIANGNDAVVGLIEETWQAIPEVSGLDAMGNRLPNVGAARTIQGLDYKTLVRTANPVVNFRDANQGQARTKATHENRTFGTYILNPRWGADKAVADRHEDGAEAYLSIQAAAHTEAGLQTLGKVFYYGRDATFGDAKGFPGLLASVDASMVKDAGGTTDNTASSVWGVRFGEREVRWVYGANGQMELSEVSLRDMTDDDGDEFTGYHQELTGYPGLQVASTRSVGRIKKITEDAGKTLDDDLIASFLTLWKKPPHVLFMSRRSQEQLRKSRTATNATGTPAPPPMDAFNIPISVTDSIVDTETLAL